MRSNWCEITPLFYIARIVTGVDKFLKSCRNSKAHFNLSLNVSLIRYSSEGRTDLRNCHLSLFHIHRAAFRKTCAIQELFRVAIEYPADALIY